MNKNFEWHERLPDHFLCDLNGKILGSVIPYSSLNSVYTAKYGYTVLGQYISLETAKKAVEGEFDGK